MERTQRFEHAAKRVLDRHVQRLPRRRHERAAIPAPLRGWRVLLRPDDDARLAVLALGARSSRAVDDERAVLDLRFGIVFFVSVRARAFFAELLQMKALASLVFVAACSTTGVGSSPNGGPYVPDPTDAGVAHSPAACLDGACACSNGNCSGKCATPPCSMDCSDGNCALTCPAEGGPCNMNCSNGWCATYCGAGLCQVDCSNGHCNTSCPKGATCDVSCSNGGCLTACAAGSTCSVDCSSGGCTLECEAGAKCSFVNCSNGGCVCHGAGCT